MSPNGPVRTATRAAVRARTALLSLLWSILPARDENLSPAFIVMAYPHREPRAAAMRSRMNASEAIPDTESPAISPITSIVPDLPLPETDRDLSRSSEGRTERFGQFGAPFLQQHDDGAAAEKEHAFFLTALHMGWTGIRNAGGEVVDAADQQGADLDLRGASAPVGIQQGDRAGVFGENGDLPQSDRTHGVQAP